MSISARVNLIITAERDEDIDELLQDIRDHRTDVPNPFPMYIQMVEVSREWQEGEPRGTLHGPEFKPTCMSCRGAGVVSMGPRYNQRTVRCAGCTGTGTART